MKTASLPAIRVQPEVRQQIESVLREGETLSSFVEATVREAAQRRIEQAAFVERGRLAMQEYRRTGVSYSIDEVMKELRAKADVARKKHRSQKAK